MAHVLVIDDDANVCATMLRIVDRMGHQSRAVHTLAQGVEALKSEPVDLVFLDVRLPDGDGLAALPQIIAAPSRPEVIILTGQGDPDGAELAIQGGVWDYLVKPTPLRDTMLTVERALKYRAERTHCMLEPEQLDLSGLVAESPAIRPSLEQLAQAARSDSPVLITGETGTGKELFARKIHDSSARKQANFVVVDCAALSENLVESILFGHKRGAFTGADRDAAGLIPLAHGGTLFLDEIGELPLDTQRAFLRVLQEKRFRPVGDVQERESDFRLVAATNRELQAMIDQGTFRSDLFYRLRAIHLELPPLRHRREDIRPLTQHYLKEQAKRQPGQDPRPKNVDEEFYEHLKSYRWPGNIRELFGVLDTAWAAAGPGNMLYARHLPSELRIAKAKAAFAPSAPQGGNKELSTIAADTAEPSAPPPAISRDVPSSAGGATPLAQHGNEEPQPAPVFQESPAMLDPSLPPPNFKDYKTATELAYLEHLLDATARDVNEMLQTSGLSKSHLYALLKKHNLGGR